MSDSPLYLNPYLNLTVQAKKHYKQTVGFLRDKLNRNGPVLDIGGRSPMTEVLEHEFQISIVNTTGDLDESFKPDKDQIFDTIIYSHTIEHQFNPLFTLLRIKELMSETSMLFIMVPSRGKLLWAPGHFHEIDRYRMGLLLERAGFKIIGYERRKHWRGFWDYFKGVRMMLRLFVEYDAYYSCTLK